jgi:hypothetical protein
MPAGKNSAWHFVAFVEMNANIVNDFIALLSWLAGTFTIIQKFNSAFGLHLSEAIEPHRLLPEHGGAGFLLNVVLNII